MRRSLRRRLGVSHLLPNMTQSRNGWRALPRSLRTTLSYALGSALFIAALMFTNDYIIGPAARGRPWHLAEAALFVALSAALLQRLLRRHRDELQQLARARDQTRQLFEQLLDGADDAIYAKDLDGRYLLLNRAAQRVAAGATCDVDLPASAAQLADIRAHDRRVLESRQTVRSDEAMDGVEGAHVYEVIKGPLFGADGDLRGVFGISRDVTEARRDAERLRLWAESFEHAGFGLAISDVASNTFVAVNPAFAQQRGWSVDALRGRSVLSVFPADRAAQMSAMLAELDASGHGVFESEHLRRDGSRFPVQLDITVLRDAQGRAVNRIAYALDISARRSTEAKLKQSQLQLRTFVATAPVAMAMFDRDMRYLAYSDRWLAEYGRGHAALGGLSHYVVHPDLPPAWREAHRRGLQGETLRRDADAWTLADGTRRWIRWAVVPWHDTEGAIGGIIVSTEDVTEAKAARDAIAEREARYRAAIESAADGFWVVDLQAGRLRDVNDAYARASGYSREQLLGMAVAELEAIESADEVAAHVARVRRDGHDSFVTRHRRRDGSTWPVEIHVAYRAEAGGYAYAFLRDVSDRLALEQRIVDAGSAEQERLGREIHDGIGQQLSALGMLARSLQQRLARSGQRAEADAAGELLRLLQQVLREARQLARGLAPLDIAAHGLGDALTLLVHGAHGSGVHCRAEIGAELPELPPAVALHLYRMAQEALHNALRHARARHIVVALHAEGDGVTLSVRDDGRGISGSARGGIGLSTLAYRARAIGAQLRIDGQRGRGTQVECHWSRAASPA